MDFDKRHDRASITVNESMEQLARLGYALLPQVFEAREVGSLVTLMSTVLQSSNPAVLRSRGRTYGSRDLATLVPEVRAIAKQHMLRELIAQTLGEDAALVRALYFDKPPDRSWSLPWHKDRTISVKDNRIPSSHFSKPTVKAGIPHVEAHEALLATMLTLRVHLDPMTADNGPLSVMPGSHLVDAPASAAPLELHAAAGDVLAMRPLLSHSSSLPKPGTTQHRRVIHLELAPIEHLPDGYAWHSFYPVG